VHCASPFPASIPSDEMTIITPAVEGTLTVLRAAQKYGVKRVVITSSIASVSYKKEGNQKDKYDESDWSDVEACGAYEKSKMFAEKAALEFVKLLPADQKFELVFINPGLVIGPNIIECDFTSSSLIKRLMSGKLPGVAKIMLPLVDVREVAEAHL
jgi:dihydroflavonol-4-reductase